MAGIPLERYDRVGAAFAELGHAALVCPLLWAATFTADGHPLSVVDVPLHVAGSAYLVGSLLWLAALLPQPTRFRLRAVAASATCAALLAIGGSTVTGWSHRGLAASALSAVTVLGYVHTMWSFTEGERRTSNIVAHWQRAAGLVYLAAATFTLGAAGLGWLPQWASFTALQAARALADLMTLVGLGASVAAVLFIAQASRFTRLAFETKPTKTPGNATMRHPD